MSHEIMNRWLASAYLSSGIICFAFVCGASYYVILFCRRFL